jgi:hypothetical protein
VAVPVHPLSTNRPSRAARRARLTLAVAGLLLVALGSVGLRPRRASAAVVHGSGFDATVLGWTSWYGSYELPSVGTSWCIDHGLHAPDTTYAYRPTEVDRPLAVTTAMAWLLAAHGAADRPAGAAAVMLVLHDLMGATYPYGRLDVDALQLQNLAGFGGQEPSVLALARAWKADALAHAALRGPIGLHLSAEAPASAGWPPPAVVALVSDAQGRPVGGVAVTFTGAGVPGGRLVLTTDPAGHARFGLAAPPPSGNVAAEASVPDLHLSAFSAGPSAQRVARPAHLTVHDSLAWSPPPPAVLKLRKVDRQSGQPVAGAVLAVARDANHDGSAEGWIRHVTTAETPVVLPALPPGSYLVSETTAPPGYRLDPTPQRVELVSGATATVTLADDALPPTTTTTSPPPTTLPPTTTSVPPTTLPPTTTSPPPTTSTIPPTTTSPPPSTTTPPSSSPSTAPAPPRSAPPSSAPPTSVTPAPPTPPLAFTGAATKQWASVGVGLLLLGAAALASRRTRPPS